MWFCEDFLQWYRDRPQQTFERLTMNDAIKKYAGIDFDEVADDEAAKKLADEHHIEYEERT